MARKHTRFSLAEIGLYFGGRDHTTVLHAVRTVDADRASDKSVADQLGQIEGALIA
jgi:chromosomal replication initiator protein